MNLLSIIFILKIFFFHPVHVSITNVELKTDEKTVSYSILINTEDLQFNLLHLYNREISLNSISKDVQIMINTYFNEVFKIMVDEIPVQFSLTDTNIEEEKIRFYYTGKIPETSLNSIVIENKILLDLYLDQTNLLIISLNGEDRGYTFNYSTQKITVNL